MTCERIDRKIIWLQKSYKIVCLKQEKREKVKEKKKKKQSATRHRADVAGLAGTWSSLHSSAERSAVQSSLESPPLELRGGLPPLARCSHLRSPRGPKHIELCRSLAGDATPPHSQELHCCGSTRRKQEERKGEREEETRKGKRKENGRKDALNS